MTAKKTPKKKTINVDTLSVNIRKTTGVLGFFILHDIFPKLSLIFPPKRKRDKKNE